MRAFGAFQLPVCDMDLEKILAEYQQRPISKLLLYNYGLFRWTSEQFSALL